MKLITNSTQTALWHEVVHEAAGHCATTLKEDLESYLVFLLMRYLNHPELIKQIVAYEFLRGMQARDAERSLLLQEVGDKCLIITGLFPFLAEKKLVKISYFVNLGQSSYMNISTQHNDIYHSLAKEFIPLMDVLQSIRQHSAKYPDLMPMQAYELWHETGSNRAFKILNQYTKGNPRNIRNS